MGNLPDLGIWMHITSPLTRTCLHTDLGIVQNNYTIYKTLCGADVTVSAVVKSNAYSCGMTPVTDALIAMGCTYFWVATLDEAIALRTHVRTQNHTDTHIRIGVLEGIFDCMPYHEYALVGVVNHPAQLRHTLYTPCWIHIDTGMNRLGLYHTTATAHIQDHISAHAHPHIVGYMTHLMSAENSQAPTNPLQLSRFRQAIAPLPPKPTSLANSDGTLLGAEYHGHMVRIGYGLYGLHKQQHGFQCAVQCTTPILNISQISKGDTVGYNATFTANRTTYIATVRLGYNDGINLSLSNQSYFLYKGVPCPIVGRVSMDLVCLDITDISPRPNLGDMVALFHDFESIHHISKTAHIPPHAVICTLGGRIINTYTSPHTL